MEDEALLDRVKEVMSQMPIRNKLQPHWHGVACQNNCHFVFFSFGQPRFFLVMYGFLLSFVRCMLAPQSFYSNSIHHGSGSAGIPDPDLSLDAQCHAYGCYLKPAVLCIDTN